MRERALAGKAGCVGHGRNGELQVCFVKGGGSLGDEGGEKIAVGPIDVFEINLKTAVSVLLALVEKRGDEGRLRRWSRKQFVKIELDHERDDRHDRDMMVGRDFHHVGIGPPQTRPLPSTPYQAGTRMIDFVRVLGERLHRIGIVDHVEERFGLSGGDDGAQKRKRRRRFILGFLFVGVRKVP